MTMFGITAEQLEAISDITEKVEKAKTQQDRADLNDQIYAIMHDLPEIKEYTFTGRASKNIDHDFEKWQTQQE